VQGLPPIAGVLRGRSIYKWHQQAIVERREQMMP
jgi:hypothetical protein